MVAMKGTFYRSKAFRQITRPGAARFIIGGKQGPAGAQGTQGEAGIAPPEAMASVNMAVNPFVDVSQELGTTGATLASGTRKYTADMWAAQYVHGAGTAVITSGQVAASSFLSAVAGFSFAHRIKATAAISSPANGDYARHVTYVEGWRIAKLGWGAADALDLAYAKMFYSSASGVAILRVANNAGDRAYHRELTLAAGWNFFSGTIPGDTSGTWLATTGIGAEISIIVAGKESSPATPDAWGSSPKVQTTNSTNLLGINNNETLVTGLYLGAGPDRPAQANLPRLRRPFDEELLRSKRYWEASYSYGVAPGTVTSGGCAVTFTQATQSFHYLPTQRLVAKRATPSVTLYSTDTGTSGKIGCSDGDIAGTAAYLGQTAVNIVVNNVSVTGGKELRVQWAADARL